MKLNWFTWMSVVAGVVWAAGCVSTPDGRSVGGVPWSKNKIESRYNRSATEIWTAAKDVLRYNGTLYGEDLLKSTLEGSVNERRVWIKVEELDKSVTRVTVQTRTSGGAGDLELAGELDKQIAIRLATGNLTPGSAAYPKP